MQVTKLRARSDANGFVPMGQYIARIAEQLEKANAREAKLQAKLDAEDARLEALYRRAHATRNDTYARSAALAFDVALRDRAASAQDLPSLPSRARGT